MKSDENVNEKKSNCTISSNFLVREWTKAL